MLPSFLESTYKRYKNDTSIFVEWLLDNGTKCVHTVAIKPTSVTPVVSVKSARLKGKARKEAQKADGKVKPAPPPAGPSKKVSPGQLLPLAQAIANAKSAIKVPNEITQAEIRAVSSRKKCTTYFSTKIEQDVETLRDNRGHSYFVSLVEEVLLTLQPCFAVSVGQTDVESKAKNTVDLAVSMEELENRYAVLELEEPPEENQTIPLTASIPVTSEKTIVEVETPENKANQEEDKIFAIFCLSDDLFELRKYALEIWTDYQEGLID